MVSSVRAWATAALLVSLLAVAAPAAAAAPPALVLTLPDRLVVGSDGSPPFGDVHGENIPGQFVVEGCPDPNAVVVEATYFTPGGNPDGDAAETFDGYPEEQGRQAIALRQVVEWFESTGQAAGGSMVFAVECSPLGDTAVAAIPVLELQFQLPTGTTIETLQAEADPGSAVILGCGEGSSNYMRIAATYWASIDGEYIEMPVAEVPGQAVVDGVVEFPLTEIAEWLKIENPALGSLILEATCFSPSSTPSPDDAISFAWILIPGNVNGGSELLPTSEPEVTADSTTETDGSNSEMDGLAVTGGDEVDPLVPLLAFAMIIAGAIAVGFSSMQGRRKRQV
ncbi:hypothetical protein FHX48_002103 [Microbacterium halimionae]|uniref:LPXTG-motif cell wall anchor domain-containing protein n=1 Tax=Microbacterium halimionae TaxID=1526413 RepID=A0A7W3JQ89_9MICO|nr:hypothetical protein [Microbacterium halimionae]MBA8817009.1 hypothetical protein [Microbacterium halimionae]NII94452.1 hypothetical protein [Microbacterium halimionae]